MAMANPISVTFTRSDCITKDWEHYPYCCLRAKSLLVNHEYYVQR